MSPLVYLDQNVFSYMLKEGGKDRAKIFTNSGLTIVFTEVHLREMSGLPKEYGKLLTKIDAVFVRPPSKETPFQKGTSWSKRDGAPTDLQP